MEASLQAKPRKVFGKLNRKLRSGGFLPAVLYGRGKPTLSLEVSQKEFEKVYRQSGENTLVNLMIEGQGERKVLIHEVAHHFMKREPVHVDFYEVDMTRKIHAKVPLHFVGTAPAVKELGGILIKNLSEVTVEALPADLPQFLEINIEGLKTLENLVRLGELPVDDKLKILGQPEDVVVSVQPPRSEEELAELEKPAAEAEKEVIAGMEAEVQKEKAEKAEGTESEKAEAAAAAPAEAKKEKEKPEKK